MLIVSRRINIKNNQNKEERKENLYVKIKRTNIGWEMRRSPVIQLLGGRGCRIVCGRELWLSLCYVDQTSAPRLASICVALEESRATRLSKEEGTGPEPKGSRSNLPCQTVVG